MDYHALSSTSASTIVKVTALPSEYSDGESFTHDGSDAEISSLLPSHGTPRYLSTAIPVPITQFQPREQEQVIRSAHKRIRRHRKNKSRRALSLGKGGETAKCDGGTCNTMPTNRIGFVLLSPRRLHFLIFKALANCIFITSSLLGQTNLLSRATKPFRHPQNLTLRSRPREHTSTQARIWMILALEFHSKPVEKMIKQSQYEKVMESPAGQWRFILHRQLRR